jgi:hypothetical protein
MSKKNPRDKPAKYLALPHHMLNSAAWKSLSATARAIYIDMAKRYFGTNNGRIAYSVRCAVDEMRIGLATVKRALDDLTDRGFIVPIKKGAFSYKVRHATEWRLTQFPTDNPIELATKDFMKWTPDENKTRYPQRNCTVAVAEPIGSCSGTNPDSDTSHGSCSGTVEVVSGAVSVAVAEHLYITSTLSSIRASPSLMATGIFQKGVRAPRSEVRPSLGAVASAAGRSIPLKNFSINKGGLPK